MTSVEEAPDSNTPLIQNETKAIYTEKPIEQLYRKEIFESKCCCFNIAYYPAARIRLCNHWIFKPMKPIIISLIFIVVYISCMYNIIAFKEEGKSLSLLALIAIPVYTVIFIFLSFSYFGIIVRGPGYLPFNYSQNHRTNLTWDEQKITFAVYKEEVDLARYSSRPPRSSFSILARRYVLRADHYCVWTESWIGLNNYRYFLLMTLYAFLFAIGYILCLHWRGVYLFHHYRNLKVINWISTAIPVLISIFMSVVAFLSGMHFSNAFYNLCINKTGIERYKETKEKRYIPYTFDRGCCNNFSEVCGQKKFCPVWWIPIFCLKPTEDGLYTNIMSSQYDTIKA